MLYLILYHKTILGLMICIRSSARFVCERAAYTSTCLITNANFYKPTRN